MSFLMTVSAFAVPGFTTYQAKIIKPDGLPLETNGVNFRFTILDPAASCILYVEEYSAVNMSNTGGVISFSLGTGTKLFPTSGTATFADVFNNATSVMSCQSGAVFNPTSSDIRKIVMQFNDTAGWQTLPAMNINAVPYAMYAAQSSDSTLLNGKSDSAFVEYSSIPTCTASQALQYTGVGFACVATGGSGGGSYTVTSSDITSALGYIPVNPASMTASQWTTSSTMITYVSGSVGVGTTVPDSTFEVSGSTRLNGTLVMGNNPPMSGLLDLGGLTGGPVPYDARVMTQNTITNFSPIAFVMGNTNTLRLSPANDASSNNFFADLNYLNTEAGNLQPLGTMYGSLGAVEHKGSGHLGQAFGLSGISVNTGPGDITMNVGGQFIAANYGSGVIANNYGVRIGSPSGAITNNIGLMIDNQVTGSASSTFNIYSAGASAKNFFEGYVGIGQFTPTARLHLAAGSSSLAPLKFTSGSLTAAPQSGTIEYDGFNFYGTDGAGTRRALAYAGGGVTSSAVISALGYTPASYTTVANLSSSMATVGTSITTLSSSYSTLSTSYTTLAASVTALAGGSLWAASGSTIHYSSGYVGIGATSPTVMLDVKGPNVAGSNVVARLSSLMDSTTVGRGNALSFNLFDTVKISSIYVNNAPQNYALAFTTYPYGESMRINGNTGYLGIGTIAAVAKLHVHDAAASANYGYFTNGTTGALATDGTYVGASSTGNSYLMNNEAMSLILGTSATERLRIDSTGNVGIGTSSPTNALSVYRATGSDATMSITNASAGQGSYVSSIANSNYSGFSAIGTGATWYSGQYGTPHFIIGDLTNSKIPFQILQNAPTAAFHMLANGNVGLGTNNPMGRLTISDFTGKNTEFWPGSTNYIINYDRTNSTYLPVQIDASDIYLAPGGLASNGLTATASGMVGIGLTAPTSKLHVNGDIRNHFTSQTVFTNNLAILSSSADMNINYSSAKLNIFSDTTSSVTITRAGKVGIGTANPTAKLQLASGTTAAGTAPLKFVSGSLTTAAEPGALEYDGSNLYFTNDASSRQVISTGGGGGGSSQWTTSGTSIFYNNGFVGIGVSNPAYVLDILGGVNASTFLKGGGIVGSYVNNGSITGLMRAAGTVMEFGTVTTTDIRFVTNSASEKMRITNAGNVGINTSSPSSTIHVNGQATLGTGAADRSLIFNYMPSMSWRYGIRTENSGLRFDYENGGTWKELVAMMGAGQVGIATPNPSYTLDVSGTLRVTGTAYTNGGYTTWTAASDKRLKDIHGSYDRGLASILNIDTILFRYKKDNKFGLDSSKEYVGVTAQNLQTAIPEAVTEESSGTLKGYLTINTTPVLWTLINAVKELYHKAVGHDEKLEQQAREIASVKAENAEKDQKIKELEQRLEKIEKALQNQDK